MQEFRNRAARDTVVVVHRIGKSWLSELSLTFTPVI